MKPRSLVFNLYGDYVRYRGGEVALRDLTTLLSTFDVGEETARVTLSRMKREGWLRTRRAGRASYYALNDRSWRLLDQGRTRIFERHRHPWGGRWHMVIYSVPESERPTRERLRKALSWLGFGPLAPSTWISPYDRFADLEALLLDDDLKASLDLFTVDAGGPARDRELAARCWNLDGIDAAYRQFIDAYRPRLEQAASLRHIEAFVERIALVNAYRKFPFTDPDLPDDLLPSDWSGWRAHELFLRAYETLHGPAFAYYDAVVTPPPP